MPRLLLAGLFVALGLTGCNVYEGLDNEAPPPYDVEQVLSYARIEMEAGRPQNASRALNGALAHVEAGPEAFAPHTRRSVQIALSSALLAERDVDVLTLHQLSADLIDAIDYAVGDGAGQGGQQRALYAATSSAETCSFPPTHARGDTLTLDNFEVTTQLSSAAVTEVRSLADEVLAYDGPAENGSYDIDARIQQLRDEGNTDAEIREILVNGAVAYTGTSYTDLVQVGGDQVTWYAVTTSDGSETYAGYCTPDAATMEAVRSETVCELSDISFAVNLMGARADLAGTGTVAEEVALAAEDGLSKLRDDLSDATCGS